MATYQDIKKNLLPWDIFLLYKAYLIEPEVLTDEKSLECN